MGLRLGCGLTGLGRGVSGLGLKVQALPWPNTSPAKQELEPINFEPSAHKLSKPKALPSGFRRRGGTIGLAICRPLVGFCRGADHMLRLWCFKPQQPRKPLTSRAPETRDEG